MIKYFELGLIFIFLMAGFTMLLCRLELLSRIKKAFVKASVSIDEKDRKTRMLRRRNLQEFEKKNNLWLKLEEQIEYSGLRLKYPRLTAGKLIVINLCVSAILFWVFTVIGGIKAGMIAVGAGILTEFGTIEYLKSKNLRAVDEELPKLLDFLGNYSLSSGELISIFSQISRYLKEPLRSVIEECESESKITGDMRTALISMADRVEHPQFKQLVRNLEITARYSADFGALVSDSRRGMREYLSQNRDRKGMLREAGINMGLLLIMSVIVLMIVNVLIGGGIAGILFNTFVGHMALGGMVFIIVLFFAQVFTMK